jgi:Zn-dependent membrane protease YugP
MFLYLIVFIPLMILGFWAQRRVGSTYAEWSAVRSSTGITGAEMARRILDRNGLQDVEVRHVPGNLSDHYSPLDRTVNLSDDVHNSGSIAAIAVAAHEVGHAIQHQKAYAPFRVRSALFPAAQFGSSAFMPLLMIGLLFSVASASPLGAYAILAAVFVFSFSVLFQLVTLPVEFDASRRARKQLTELNISTSAGDEAVGTAKVLNAAAMTYVVAALSAVVTLAYYVLQFAGARD